MKHFLIIILFTIQGIFAVEKFGSNSNANHTFEAPTAIESSGFETECQTEELTDLVEELNYDPLKIFQYVRDQISNEDYPLCRKGAEATYFTGRGNSIDKCTLLLKMLNLAGIEARYAYYYKTKKLETPLDQLDYRIAVQANLPIKSIKPYYQGEKFWVSLDPYYSRKVLVTPGFSLFHDQQGNTIIPNELDFDLQTYLRTDENRSPYELMEENIREYIKDLKYSDGSELKLHHLKDHEKIIQQNENSLPLGLPRRDEKAFDYRIVNYNKLPSFLLKKAKIALLKEGAKKPFFVKEISLVKAVNKPISMRFKQLSYFEVKPVLYIGEQVEFTGEPTWITNRFQPGWKLDTWEKFKYRPEKFTNVNLVFLLDSTSVSEKGMALLKSKMTEHNELVSQKENNLKDSEKLKNSHFYFAAKATSATFAWALKYKYMKENLSNFLSLKSKSDYNVNHDPVLLLYNKTGTVFGGRTYLDAVFDKVIYSESEGNSEIKSLAALANDILGTSASLEEKLILESAYNSEAISTINVLQKASTANVDFPFTVLTKENDSTFSVKSGLEAIWNYKNLVGTQKDTYWTIGHKNFKATRHGKHRALFNKSLKSFKRGRFRERYNSSSFTFSAWALQGKGTGAKGPKDEGIQWDFSKNADTDGYELAGSVNTLVSTRNLYESNTGYQVHVEAHPTIADVSRIVFTTGNGQNQWHELTADVKIKANHWYHITVSFDEQSDNFGTKKIYINGAEIAEEKYVTYRPNQTVDFFLGTGTDAYNNIKATDNFYGYLDDIALASFALKPEDVDSLFTGNIPLKTIANLTHELPAGTRIRIKDEQYTVTSVDSERITVSGDLPIVDARDESFTYSIELIEGLSESDIYVNDEGDKFIPKLTMMTNSQYRYSDGVINSIIDKLEQGYEITIPQHGMPLGKNVALAYFAENEYSYLFAGGTATQHSGDLDNSGSTDEEHYAAIGYDDGKEAGRETGYEDGLAGAIYFNYGSASHSSLEYQVAYGNGYRDGYDEGYQKGREKREALIAAEIAEETKRNLEGTKGVELTSDYNYNFTNNEINEVTDKNQDPEDLRETRLNELITEQDDFQFKSQFEENNHETIEDNLFQLPQDHENMVTADGDPVNLRNGEFYTEYNPDIKLASSNGTVLEINRNYHSRLLYDGPFGFGWAWNHSEQIFEDDYKNLTFYNSERYPLAITLLENEQDHQQDQPRDAKYIYPFGSYYRINELYHTDDQRYSEFSPGQFVEDENGAFVSDGQGNYNPYKIYIQLNTETVENGETNIVTTYVYDANQNYKVEDSEQAQAIQTSPGSRKGWLLQFKDGNKIIFDEEGFVSEKINPRGQKLTFTYFPPLPEDAEDYTLDSDLEIHSPTKRIATITDSFGRVLNFDYVKHLKETRKVHRVYYHDYGTNDDGEIVVNETLETFYNYDGNGDLVSYTDLDGYTTTFEYLSNQRTPIMNHNLTKIILPDSSDSELQEGDERKGDYLEIAYNENDTVNYHENQAGQRFQFSYNFVEQYAETWNEKGYYLKVHFDENGNAIRTSEKDRTLVTEVYDDNHNVKERIDARGNKWEFKYYPEYPYNLEKEIDPNGNCKKYSYHPEFNTVERIEFHKGHEEDSVLLSFTENVYYDSTNSNGKDYKHGLLKESIDAEGNKTVYDYNESSNLVTTKRYIDPNKTTVDNALTDENGTYIVSSTLFNNGNLFPSSQTDFKSQSTFFNDYTFQGYLTEEEDALANKTESTYTAYGQLKTSTRYIDENSPVEITNEYTPTRKLLTTEDPRKAKTTNVYNPARDIVSGQQVGEIIDPLGYKTTFTYDELGNKISEVDKRGNETRFFYDPMGRLIKILDPLGNAEYREYDAAGNLIKITDALGYIISYRYDELNRKVHEKDRNGNVTVYRYDDSGNVELITKGQVYTKDGILTTLPGVELIKDEMTYDKNNRLKTLTKANGTADARTTTYTYDELGRKDSEIDPYLNKTEFTYDNNGNLKQTQIFAADGSLLQTTSTQYDALNRPEVITDARGNTSTIVYDSLGRKKETIDQLGHKTEYEYDDAGNLVKQKDPTGAVTQFEYNLRGEKVRETDALGNTIDYAYDANGNLLEVVDQAGYVTFYSYDALNRRVSETRSIDDNEFVIKTQTHDALGRVIATTDEEGHVTRMTYDGNGNLLSTELPSAALWKYADNSVELVPDARAEMGIITKVYDFRNLLIKETDALGHTTHMEYDLHGQLIEVMDALGQITTHEYDSRGLLETTVNPAGQVTLNVYDDLGRQIFLSQADGTADQVLTEYTYDANGNKTAEIRYLTPVASLDNPRNIPHIKTTFVYDARNQLISTIAHGNAGENDRLSTTEYDSRGLVIQTTDPKGNETYFEYDALGRKVYEEDALGQTKTYVYDSRGNLIQEVDINGRIISYTYDGRNLKTSASEKTDQPTRTAEYKYDKRGFLVEKKDFEDVITTYRYDSRANQVSTTEAFDVVEDFLTTNSFYDQNGNLLAYKATGKELDAAAYRYRYVYDELNRLIQEIDGRNETGRARETIYDDAGNVLAVKRFDGSYIINSYDDMNRKVAISTSNNLYASKLRQSFKYDALSRMTYAAELQANGKLNEIAYSYNSFDELISERQSNTQMEEDQQNTPVKRSYLVEKSYDSNGLMSSLTYPSSRELAYSYDELNRINGISLDQQTITSEYSYTNNRLTEMKLANLFDYEAVYDKRFQEKSRSYLKHGTTTSILKIETKDYDEMGNVKHEEIAVSNRSDVVIKNYNFDKRYRLTDETLNDDTENKNFWKYDALGNWLETNQNGALETREVNEANEYQGDDYDYDGRGNLIKDQDRLFEYDWNNRLVSVKDASNTELASFTYDARNRRLTKKVGSIIRTYVYCDEKLIEEYLGDNLDKVHVYSDSIDDIVMSQLNDGDGLDDYYYLKDRQGNICAVTDAAGVVKQSYFYSAYGQREIFDDQGKEVDEGNEVQYQSSAITNFGYTGRYYDPETDLWHYRNRMYSATVGRFLQRDPAGFVDGLNYYAYVKNNPINFIDPWGLQAQSKLNLLESSSYNERYTTDDGVEVFRQGDGFMSHELRINPDGSYSYNSNSSPYPDSWEGPKIAPLTSEDIQNFLDDRNTAYIDPPSSNPPRSNQIENNTEQNSWWDKGLESAKSFSSDFYDALAENRDTLSERGTEFFRGAADFIAESSVEGFYSAVDYGKELKENPFNTIRGSLNNANPIKLAEGLYNTSSHLIRNYDKIYANARDHLANNYDKPNQIGRWAPQVFMIFAGGKGLKNWGKAPNSVPGVDDLSRHAAEMKKGGLTRAGHSLDKHKARPGSAFTTDATKAKIKNAEAQDIVDDILTTPGSTTIQKTAKRNGQDVEVIDVTAPDGRGFRFDLDTGQSTGFREP